jgi:thiol-disulfide isomerase/thioredoxin
MKRIVLSTLIACATTFGLNAQIQGYTVGQTVADFTVTDTDGNTHTLSTYTNAGKWVVLDFFFVDCPPCQATAPIFNELHEKYGCNSADLVCISVNTGQDTDADVQGFEATHGGSFSHAPAISGDGGSSAVNTAFNPTAYPTYCLIGADMKLKNADIWPLANVGSFETAFSSAGFSPAPTACSAVASTEELTLTDAQIFPNPSAGNVSVRFNNAVSSDVTIEVTNMVGQIVYSSSTSSVAGSNAYDLNLADLNDGQYIVKIDNGQTQTIAKVQISK